MEGAAAEDAVRDLFERHFGGRFALGAPVDAELLHGAAELAAGMGPRQAYEFLLGRHLDANPGSTR